MEPRKVRLLRSTGEYNKITRRYVMADIGAGFCHGFCQQTDGDQMECNAIIEREDGTVTTVDLRNIQFVEPLK